MNGDLDIHSREECCLGHLINSSSKPIFVSIFCVGSVRIISGKCSNPYKRRVIS